MAEPTDVERTGAQVEQLLDQLTTTGGPVVARCGEQLVRALMGLYGAGLARIVALLDQPGLERLTGDRVVAGLLVLHDLHPQSTEQRVRDALERLRPYLGGHGGQLELLGVDGAVVRLRLPAGCPSSAETVRQAAQRAIGEVAPEVGEILVEPAAGPSEPPLLQIRTGAAR